jgi:hypothetical protein
MGFIKKLNLRVMRLKKITCQTIFQVQLLFSKYFKLASKIIKIGGKRNYVKKKVANT